MMRPASSSAMAGTAALAQAPSRSKDDVAAAIARLKPQGGTALGNGVLIALTALLPEATNEAERLMNDDMPQSRKPPASGSASSSSSDSDTDAVTPGSYSAGAIVLFSDGESNAGPGALQAKPGEKLYVLGIEGMSCPIECAPKVKESIQSIEGVRQVEVSFEDKRAIVHTDPSVELTTAQVDQSFKNQGYFVSSLETIAPK